MLPALLLAGCVLVALMWAVLLAASLRQRLMHFVYTCRQTPDTLNHGFAGDDVTHAFAGDPDEWPSVTVIVPGRNEGHLLEKTLGSLCAMDYPQFRVVFIDDQSTDNTAAVCRQLESRHAHLTVIHNSEPPRDGWVGKTWAVHQAEAHMHESDYLLFTDSDLEFHPQCMTQMIRLALHRRTDIASSLPAIRYETLGELLGMISAVTIINTRLSLAVCNDPKKPQALVAGGFLLIRREVYHELGGHAGVRGQMVEDIAFGKRAKALGRRVFTCVTHDLFTARMYEGWRDTYEGLKKNAYAGANYSLPFACAIVVFLLFFGALVPVYAAMGIAWAIAAPLAVTLGVAVAGSLALFFQLAMGVRTARFVGMRVDAALWLPLGFAFYLAVFLGSVIDYYTGGNRWAGRRVAKAESLADAAKSVGS